MKPVVVGLLLLAATGCTTIGVHVPTDVSFGPPDTVRLCAYLDNGITWEEADALVREAWSEEAARYALDMRIVRFSSSPRPAYTYQGIMDAFVRVPLQPPCDRNVYFVNRHLGDVVWGLIGLGIPLPEVMGAVDDATGTRIMVVARRSSILSLLVLTPTRALRHELEHSLGCGHSVVMTSCYESIASLKAMHRLNPNGMFPTRLDNGITVTEWRDLP